MRLQAQEVSWSVDGHKIVRSVSAEAHPGELVGLIGPNGSGKSSLLRCVYRVLRPDAGLVSLDGEDVWRINARQMSRRTAVVVQESQTDFDFTVREIVAMGRTPHKGLLERDDEKDERIVEDALSRVDVLHFAERSFLTLSGGEKQRVLLARALAQKARFLVLDEPTNHLDIRYQLELLSLVRDLGVTTLAALHDLNLAALYCDRLYALAAGKVAAEGTPEEVLTPRFIRELYGVEAEVEIHRATGRPHVSFLPPGVWAPADDASASQASRPER
jgi:iron complex transport system ATP-binding protein